MKPLLILFHPHYHEGGTSETRIIGPSGEGVCAERRTGALLFNTRNDVKISLPSCAASIADTPHLILQRLCGDGVRLWYIYICF